MIIHRKGATPAASDQLGVIPGSMADPAFVVRGKGNPESLNSAFIGGKSLGGRIASLIADEAGVAGLVCLGYPFHSAGKPDRLRIDHLKTIRTPTLILQGDRDPLGRKDEVVGYKLPRKIQIRWLPDGDHSFKPRKAPGRTQEENWREGIKAVVQFIRALKRG